MKIALIQAAWPRPKKGKDPVKYFPHPLIKLAGAYRNQGHEVAVVYDKGTLESTRSESGDLFVRDNIPFIPDVLAFTSVFSWWFDDFLRPCIERYHTAYPSARVLVGGVHASLDSELFRKTFPYADVHVGTVSEAEEAEPAWDLMPSQIRTQIVRFSSGCPRSCSFCYCNKERYEAFPFETVAKRIRFNRLILNDNNLLAHPDVRHILRELATFTVNGKPISSCECQGGFDIRILSKDLTLIELLKAARFGKVRLAWDGGFEMLPMLKACIDALAKAGYDRRNVRVYCLYNHDLPFEVIADKLRVFESMGQGVIHSRFRPLSLLSDHYEPRRREQTSRDYYIHESAGWSDKKIRIIGSLASDISRMARAGKLVKSVDDVRRYYGRPTFDATLRLAA